MNHTTYSISTSDGKSLFMQMWTAEQNSLFTILLIHGIGEHSGRYESWAEKFTLKGYNFASFDLRGHGRSTGKRGHVQSMECFLTDIDLVFRKITELIPGTRIILYGHSMGGNIALNHVIHHNLPLQALIVTSPWLKLSNPPSPMLALLASVLNKFLPFLSLSNGLNPDDLSHDPEVARLYKSDPLTHDRISARLYHVANQGGLHALRNVYKINCPFLIMHGTADAITSPKASESYVMNTSKRTRLKLWTGQYHELHNEFIRDEVFNYIISWLDEHKQ